MVKKLLLIFLFLFFFSSYSQLTPISKNTKISVLTVGCANESHSLYGHTAIRINDASTNFDYIYNYGMFDFQTENFVLKFVKGDMQYFAAAYPYIDFEYSYRIENRSIFEQVLNFSLEEKQLLFEKLNQSLNSESKYYTYKFIDRNCTTKVVDVLNEVLQRSPITKKNIDSKTNRDVLFPYAINNFYQKLGINIIFGKKVDEQASKIFLPFDLYENLKKTNYDNKPLVQESRVLFQAVKTKYPFNFLDSIYSLIVILLLFILFDSKISRIIYFSILGLLGLFFSLVGFYSFHQEIVWNYNVLLFNPLFLILGFSLLKNKTKMSRQIAVISSILLLIYLIYMISKIHLLIVLPIIITNAILLLNILLSKKKLLTSVK